MDSPSIKEYVDGRHDAIEQVVTLQLDGFKTEFNGRLDGFRTEFTGKLDGFRTEFNAKLDGFRSEFNAKLDGFKVEFDAKLDARFAEMRGEMHKGFSDVIKWCVGTMIAGLVVGITMVNFMFTRALPYPPPQQALPATHVSMQMMKVQSDGPYSTKKVRVDV